MTTTTAPVQTTREHHNGDELEPQSHSRRLAPRPRLSQCSIFFIKEAKGLTVSLAVEKYVVVVVVCSHEHVECVMY
jgi:hypothetical protein